MKCGYIQCSSTPLFCHSSVHWLHHLVVSLRVDSRGPLKSRYTESPPSFVLIMSTGIGMQICIQLHVIWFLFMLPPIMNCFELLESMILWLTRKNKESTLLLVVWLHVSYPSYCPKLCLWIFSREPVNTACHLAGLHWLLQSSVEEAARDINFRSTFKSACGDNFDFHCPIKKCLKWWKLHL